MKLDFSYTEYFRPGYTRDDNVLDSACYLCGAKGVELEVEHVIPKIIFASINPKKYVKLKACSGCNRAKGMEDEYIGRLIQGTSFNDHAIVGMDDGKRGLSKGHGLGIYTDHVSRSVPAERMVVNETHASSSKVEVPLDRLNDFQINIAKGLWTTLSNHIYNWEGYNFLTETTQIIDDPTVVTREVLIEAEKDARYSQEWSGVFKYAGDFVNDDASFWIMKYYDMHVAVVAIAKKSLSSFDLHELIFPKAS